MGTVFKELISQQYTPKHYGKEYCRLHSSMQYPMFVATALGVKPTFDDWIPVQIYEKFVSMCHEYGLVVEPDVVFSTSKIQKQDIVGGKNITTTYQDAQPFSKDVQEGTVHIFVSRSRALALEAKKYGWYAVIINNRSTNKPFVDNLRFGSCLGYPDCCIDFFRKFNNWHLFSHPFETFKNTRFQGSSMGSYYCNNHLMDKTYFLIHHLPCSYRCEKTITLARKVEETLQSVEPEFVQQTRQMLQKPLLVFQEQNFIMLEGIFEQEKSTAKITYSDLNYIHNPSRSESSITFLDQINEGNTMLLDSEHLRIYRDTDLIRTIKRKPEWFMIGFE